MNIPAIARGPIVAAIACCCLSGISPVGAGLPALDCVMDRDPRLPTQSVEHYVPDDWQQLWIVALEGPEDELRSDAAAAVIRAQRDGCKDLDAFRAPLRQALATSKNASVRLTIATALIALDATDAAADLLGLVEAGGDRESLVIEPALAKWQHPPLRDIWLARVAAPQDVSRRRLLLAIECLQSVGETRAEPPLRSLVLDYGQTAAVRLAAAEALGAVHTADVLDAARQLAADKSPRAMVNRLAAARLIGAEKTPPAQELLARLGVDPQPAVAALAVGKLLAIDPGLVLPLTPELLQRPDAELRLLAAKAIFEQPGSDGTKTLAGLLNDPHLDVRVLARVSLEKLAERPELRETILELALAGLQSSNWQGLEQSSHLVGDLDHKPAAPRLLELVEHERPDVSITAAWALSRLVVPETAPVLHKFAERLTAHVPVEPENDNSPASLSAAQDVLLSHVFQMFGLLKYAEAEPLLLKFVPRRYDLGPQSRGAAVFALGYVHAGDPNPDVARVLAERVADAADFPRLEPVEVRANAAIGLGRMNVPDAVEVLRAFYKNGNPGDRIREACGWALEQITGEDLPDPATKRAVPATPFLQPIAEPVSASP